MNNNLIIAFSLYGIGGAQRRAFNLAKYFDQHGYNVHILAIRGNDSTIENKNFYNSDGNINITSAPEFYQIKKSFPRSFSIASTKKKSPKIIGTCNILAYPSCLG